MQHVLIPCHCHRPTFVPRKDHAIFELLSMETSEMENYCNKIMEMRLVCNLLSKAVEGCASFTTVVVMLAIFDFVHFKYVSMQNSYKQFSSLVYVILKLVA